MVITGIQFILVGVGFKGRDFNHSTNLQAFESKMIPVVFPALDNGFMFGIVFITERDINTRPVASLDRSSFMWCYLFDHPFRSGNELATPVAMVVTVAYGLFL